MAGYDFKIGINTGDSSATIENLIAEIKKIGITARQIVAVLTGQTKTVIDSFDKARDKIDNVGEAFVDVKDNVEDFGDSFEDMVDGAKQMGEGFSNIKTEAQGANSSLIDVNSTIKQLDKLLAILGGEAKGAAKPIEKLGNEIEDIEDPAKKAKEKIDGLGDGAKKAGEKTEKASNGFSALAININQKIQLFQTGIAALSNLISKPLAQAGQFQSMQMSMEVLLGSADKAKERLEELYRFAKGTSFELPEFVQASNELQSLGKYSRETLKMLSNLAMGTGKSLEQVTNAYVGECRYSYSLPPTIYKL